MLYINTNLSIGETSLRPDFAINGIVKNNVFQSLNFTAIKQQIIT